MLIGYPTGRKVFSQEMKKDTVAKCCVFRYNMTKCIWKDGFVYGNTV
jgi:hypothetical protein